MTTILFENAAVFDGESPELRQPVSVLVEGNRIREVRDGAIARGGAEVVDCHGKTLMPGMIDCHVHVYIHSVRLGADERPATYYAHYAATFLKHILDCGFTTVRDVAGGDHGLAMALDRGWLQGPRFFYGGRALSQTGGHGDFRGPGRPAHDLCACGAEHNELAILADGVDACIKAVREELRKGAHHIKIMGSGGVMSPSDPIDRMQYSDAEITAIVDECRRRGAYVAAHCHPDDAVLRSARLGVRTIEHATLISEATAREVRDRGAYIVPTFSVMGAIRDDGKSMGIAQRSLDKLASLIDHAYAGLENMRRADVRMGFGTDLLAEQHTRQGTEFTMRAEVLSPFEILRSATSIGAEIVGRPAELGVVRADALADLLVVRGNPLEDLGLLASGGRDLEVIMKDGAFVKRASA
jgi:imidazolonepropionase-like amidohydrolase